MLANLNENFQQQLRECQIYK